MAVDEDDWLQNRCFVNRRYVLSLQMIQSLTDILPAAGRAKICAAQVLQETLLLLKSRFSRIFCPGGDSKLPLSATGKGDGNIRYIREL